MSNVREFKSKQQKFEDWLKEISSNYKNCKNALVISQDDEGINIGYFNCGYQEMALFKTYLDIEIIHRYLQNNINRYLEYVE